MRSPAPSHPSVSVRPGASAKPMRPNGWRTRMSLRSAAHGSPQQPRSGKARGRPSRSAPGRQAGYVRPLDDGFASVALEQRRSTARGHGHSRTGFTLKSLLSEQQELSREMAEDRRSMTPRTRPGLERTLRYFTLMFSADSLPLLVTTSYSITAPSLR